MPYAIFFMENHDQLYKYPIYKPSHTSGIILRQFWNFSALLLAAAFGSTLKSILIKQIEPKILQTNQDVLNSGRPFILTIPNKIEYKSLETSPLAFDRWMHSAAQSVHFWTT